MTVRIRRAIVILISILFVGFIHAANNKAATYDDKKAITSGLDASIQMPQVGKSTESHQLYFAPESESNYSSKKQIYFVITLFSVFGIFLFWYRNQFVLTIISVFVAIVLVDSQLEEAISNERNQTIKLDLIQEIGSVSARLEGVLRTNLSMLTGFAAYISAVPELSQREFSNYAKELFKKEPLLINFASAKDLIVNYVYPLEGNEKVIGLNYNKNEAQRKMALQVGKTGKLMVVGPVNLVQGGTAFIGRAPIFTGDGDKRHFWGIISAPLDEFKLYQESGLSDIHENFEVAIKSFDSLGNEGEVFFGNPSVFNSTERVEYSIQVGGGRWHIAATTIGTANQFDAYIVTVRIASLLAAILIASFAFFRIRQKAEKQRLQDTIVDHRRLLEKVGSVAKIGGWKVDANQKITQWTSQTSTTLRQAETFSPKDISDLKTIFPHEDFEKFQKALKIAIEHRNQIDIDIRLRSSGNLEKWIHVLAKPSTRSEDSITITGTFQDVSDKVLSAKLIEHQATYDALTDLPNRILFNDRLNYAIEEAKRNKTKLSVLFIDLDRFKPVNDNFGHQVGDQLLVQTAKRIQSCVRESDTVSRISGDEFCVLLVNVNDYNNITKITELLLNKLQEPYQLAESLIHCSASIGISLYPNDGDSAQSLVSKADQAMYEVKSKGRDDWQFYTKEMQVQSERRHRLLNELILDLKENKLVPFFQPIYDLSENTIVKCEALARWPKADGTFVSPFEFITLAEESGLINKLDLYMLENSAKLIEHLKYSVKEVELSINVSPRLFHTKDKDLSNWIECIEIIAAKQPLTVEITERLLTDDSIKALEILQKLKSYGVKIAIDDFGTGYSSLSYLVKFPVDIIKIDRAFVDKLSQDETTDALVETILLMAKRLKIQVIAEGIETVEQLERLKVLNCEFGQGYYLGKPMNFDHFSKAVAESEMS